MSPAAEPSDEVSAEIEALTRVQERLTAEREKRIEERFLWIVVTIALVNVDIFEKTENAATPVIVLILELIILAVLSKRMGISSAAVLIDRVSTALAKKEVEG